MGVFDRFTKGMVEKFGSIYESTPHNYWHQYEYTGPFSKEPQGKFVIHAPMETILGYVERLKLHIRDNEIIGIKHVIRENSQDDPNFGKEPVLFVYTTRKARAKTEKILSQEHIEGAVYTENNPTVDTFTFLREGMEIQREKERRERKKRE